MSVVVTDLCLQVVAAGHANGVNMRKLDNSTITLSCDETTSADDVEAVRRMRPIATLRSPSHCRHSGDQVWTSFSMGKAVPFSATDLAPSMSTLPPALLRTSSFLTHPIFNTYHSEHQMLR